MIQSTLCYLTAPDYLSALTNEQQNGGFSSWLLCPAVLAVFIAGFSVWMRKVCVDVLGEKEAFLLVAAPDIFHFTLYY